MALADRLSRQVRFGAELAGAAWPQFLRPLALELASHRPIREVLPGVHHWTAIHPRIRLPVDSYYIESARIVLDPMVPREGLGWFERRGGPSQIVLTNRHHLRHSERYAEAFGCPIRCSDAGLRICSCASFGSKTRSKRHTRDPIEVHTGERVEFDVDGKATQV